MASPAESHRYYDSDVQIYPADLEMLYAIVVKDGALADYWLERALEQVTAWWEDFSHFMDQPVSEVKMRATSFYKDYVRYLDKNKPREDKEGLDEDEKGLGVLATAGEFGSRFEQVKVYLPDEQDSLELPRWWLANVFNTVIGEASTAWVHEQYESHRA